MAGPCLSSSLSQKACDDVGGRAYSDRIRPLVTRTPLSLAHQAVYQGAATAWPVLISERISPAWAGAGVITAKVATNAKATMGATTEGFLVCCMEKLQSCEKIGGSRSVMTIAYLAHFVNPEEHSGTLQNQPETFNNTPEEGFARETSDALVLLIHW